MALAFTGQLAGKRVSKYEGKERIYLQFIEPKADGSMGFLEFRCDEGVDVNRYTPGQKYTVPVEYKHVKDKLYWNVLKESSGIGTAPRA